LDVFKGKELFYLTANKNTHLTLFERFSFFLPFVSFPKGIKFLFSSMDKGITYVAIQKKSTKIKGIACGAP
jgi:hypothetical protein